MAMTMDTQFGKLSLAAAPKLETQSAWSKAVSAKPITIFLIRLLPVFFLLFANSLPFAPCSLLFNDSIRSRQHVGRNCQADLLGRFEIDDELELDRLLDWNISGFDSL
jgi:hypothetical protein